MTALFPFQADAIDATVKAQRPVYNAFEAGLGKSRIAIETAKQLGVRSLLIACPLSAIHSWKREIGKWWPGHPPIVVIGPSVDVSGHGIFLLSYGLLSIGGARIEALKAAPPFAMTVIDEAHFLKNSKAKRTIALLVELRRNLGKVLPMSGTPAPNHAGELYAILRSLRPDLIESLKDPGKAMREAEFIERFCEVKTIRVQNRLVETIVGSRNVSELRARCSRFFMRETKARVLQDLPPLRFDVLPVDVPDPDRFKSVGQLVEDEIYDDDILAEAAGIANATLYAKLGLAKAPMVVEYVSDMLEGGVHNVVVWAVHHEVIDYLFKHLGDYRPVKLDGRDSSKSRDEAIDRFLTARARVFIGQIQAGGTAITLSGGAPPCSNAIFAETSFSPGDNWQAACRIHRIGQHDAVLARFASAAGTYDDRIQEILARKAADFAALFEKEKGDSIHAH